MTKELIVNDEIVLSGDVIGDEWAAWYEDDEAYIAPSAVRAALSGMNGKDVTVRLNSFGGHVHAGEQVRAMIAGYPGNVTIIVEGAAYSAASLILMGGGRREMTEGSTLMIHDPSSIVWGTEADMLKAAEATGTIANAAAAVYARASGKSVEECRAIMRDESWFDATAAIGAGFVHALAASPKMSGGEAARKGDPKAMFAAAQIALRARLMKSAEGRQPANMATLKGAPIMEKNEAALAAEKAAVAAKAAEDAVTAERARHKAIRDMAAPLMASGLLKDADIVAMCDDGTSVDAASAKLLSMVSSATSHRSATSQITGDVMDRTRVGMSKALYAKVGLKDGERNEFSSMTLSEMARFSINARNEKAQGGRLEMIGQAFMMAGIGHSTSDFGSILADVANKSMLKGWEEAQETYHLWTSKGIATDFKTIKRVGLTPFPTLSLIPEGAEYSYATIADFAEPVTLATYGKEFRLTRQLVINDDLGALSKVPAAMGRAARRTIGTLAYAVLSDNAAMGDGTALFHADHKNLAASGAVPGEATINAGMNAMWTQKDRSANAVALNVVPKFILAPIAQRAAVLQALNSEYAPDDTSKAGTTKQPYAYNTTKGVVEPIFDARMTGTAWYLAADPNQFDGVEISYLDGNETPFMDEQIGWNSDGIEYKVRIDAVAKAMTWESLYKNPGA